jgi:hypothetical protein
MATLNQSTSGTQFGFPLLEDLREDDHLSPVKFINLMKIDLNTFATRAHVHRNTVSRAPGSTTVQEHIRQNVRVLKAVFDLNGGDVQKALVWFKNEPLREFEYKTAEAVVAEGRADDVIKLLEMYEVGAAG